MLYYDRVDVSERNDINKTSAECDEWECDVCHYRQFSDKRFKIELHVHNGWYDVLIMSMNLSNIATLNIQDFDYHYIINGNSKNEAINLLKNADLTEK